MSSGILPAAAGLVYFFLIYQLLRAQGVAVIAWGVALLASVVLVRKLRLLGADQQAPD